MKISEQLKGILASADCKCSVQHRIKYLSGQMKHDWQIRAESERLGLMIIINSDCLFASAEEAIESGDKALNLLETEFKGR